MPDKIRRPGRWVAIDGVGVFCCMEAQPDGNVLCRHGQAARPHHLLLFPLLGKDPPAHGEHGLEALLALDGIVPEPAHREVLDLVLDPLPAAAQGRDLGLLGELRLPVVQGAVDDRLLAVDDVGPRQVPRHHGDGTAGRVDVRGLEDLRHVAGADDGLDPLRCRLLAGDEALGAKDARRGVDGAGEGVDGDDVGGLVIPRAVFPPVGG